MARKFIIEEQGRYYVCEATLEYDPALAKTSTEQEGVRHVAALLEEARQRGTCLQACEVGSESFTRSPLNTGPRE